MQWCAGIPEHLLIACVYMSFLLEALENVKSAEHIKVITLKQVIGHKKACAHMQYASKHSCLQLYHLEIKKKEHIQ